MEIGIDAVPAVLLCRATPWCKGGTLLSGPNVAAGIRGRQWPVFPPPGGLIHKKRSLLFYCFPDWRIASKKREHPIYA